MPGPLPIERIAVTAYRIPTQGPESDGTLDWQATTLVLVELDAGGKSGIGYTYAGKATATLIERNLTPLLVGKDALALNARYVEMWTHVRNLGRSGICATAISAIDIALWDWKAKLLGVPVVALLGAARDSIRAYGSGGFISYEDAHLQKQLGDWVAQGITAVKMKVGREPDRDEARVALARQAIGTEAELFVDANGAYECKQALFLAESFAASGVTWFEEPVSSDDIAGLKFMRDRGPAGMAISAGEYGYTNDDFRHLLEARAVDVLQADATRCGGFTGFMNAAALCDAFHVPLSSHCAPALHVHVDCAARTAIHLEYFFDHSRIEEMLFDGAAKPARGTLAPDLGRPGLGLELMKEEAACYRI